MLDGPHGPGSYDGSHRAIRCTRALFSRWQQNSQWQGPAIDASPSLVRVRLLNCR